MFKKLVKLLFSNSKKKVIENNYFYFEDQNSKTNENSTSQSAAQPLPVATKPIEVKSVEELHQKAFYDYLFGQTSHVEQHDEMSLYISQQVEKLLRSPQSILKNLPILPLSLSTILEQLNNDDFDTEKLIGLIQQEAIIAAKVIELANSSFYNRSNKEIKDLKTAFMLLGANGLMEGVINGFVSKLAPQSPIYFKQYGAKIWQHSLSTGVIAKALLNKSQYKSESAQGYLIGLICNLGDMIIYQLLIESFSFVHPDCQPNSYAFKDLMYKNSKKITYHIAKHWNFPASILDVLAVQTKLTKSAMLSVLFAKRPIACYVYEANILSELELMFEHNEIDENELLTAKNQLVFSAESHQYIDNLLLAKFSD
ncbi:HDOD domain-containing protein [Psychrosphaera sp. B3R10]|uniref:HDOD domain-containing protein n=1 Tax=unclassified Psychrosphaera TaxID=2641570 RepID=UPI001C0937FE|nr:MULTISPECIES: HDOD domain-containing protein [unclassified Psychrosphaera]MBU2881797.1 HDOD domain-containing protein [Psychrosphaera sp. I2R16]MBU2988077.1 HDOD domain-containing protein [Psychrosphaera sp. B3R10]